MVGQVAKDSTEMEPEKTVAFVKRHIGKGDGFSFNYNGDELKPEAISAFVLRKLAKDAESQTGEKVENVVITHPAYFGQNEIQATKDAGTIAGLNVVALMPEPVAAAYAYGLSSPENYGKTILVYDLGGGTFDATLVKIDEKEIRVITTGGDANLGGYNWDERLIDLIVDKICDQTSADRDELMEDPETRALLQNKAETIKIALSNTESQRLQLRLPVGNVKDNVTIEEFESATQDLCDRTDQCPILYPHHDSFPQILIPFDMCRHSDLMDHIRDILFQVMDDFLGLFLFFCRFYCAVFGVFRRRNRDHNLEFLVGIHQIPQDFVYFFIILCSCNV